ncbi:MAG: MarR family transcriptional regulator [Aquabacterium sp.]|nr:MarR family transcriptional regulator [Aquabacterium sp.]
MSRLSPSSESEPDSVALTPQAAIVLRQFRVVFNAIKSHFQRVESQSGLGGAQLWALSIVSRHAGTEVGALAHAMDIHQSTASNLVRALVKKGLIRSARDDEDRRVVHLHATAEGEALLANAHGPFAGLLPDALQRLDADTLTRLHTDLGHLIAQLGVEEVGTAAQTPLADL